VGSRFRGSEVHGSEVLGSEVQGLFAAGEVQGYRAYVQNFSGFENWGHRLARNGESRASEPNQSSHEKSLSRFVGFRPLKLNCDKRLVFVGWAEARNPTFRIGLNPTYQKPDFSLSHQLQT